MADAPPTRETFIENLIASNIMSQQEVDAFAASSGDSLNDSAEEFARRLVNAGKLTRYQASVIYKGKPNGLILDRYVIETQLGRGGMGSVFRAVHNQLKRRVAIKVLFSSLSKSKEAVGRFQREIEAIARLNHPNIVQAYDACEQDGTHFLVMELVDGYDLSHWVKKNGPMSPAKAADSILQAARGLEYAHGQGLIHRDIKPHNMLIGSDHVVKISDLGLARVAEDSDTDEALTASGQVFGTVDFMAPEQADDSHCVDERTDIYALGCTLHYLLTGKAPYGGSSYVAKLLAHVDKPIPSLQEVDPEIPKSLDMLFQRCLAKKPADRFASMTELIAELETIMDSGELRDGSKSESIEPIANIDMAIDLGISPSGSQSTPSFLKSRQMRWLNMKGQILGIPKPLAIAAGGAIGLIAILFISVIASSMTGSGIEEKQIAEAAPHEACLTPDNNSSTVETLSVSNSNNVESTDSGFESDPTPDSESMNSAVALTTVLTPEEDVFRVLDDSEARTQLESLADRHDIVNVDLHGFDLGNLDIQPLMKTPWLKTIDIRGTLVTPIGYAQLADALPDTEIFADDEVANPVDREVMEKVFNLGGSVMARRLTRNTHGALEVVGPNLLTKEQADDLDEELLELVEINFWGNQAVGSSNLPGLSSLRRLERFACDGSTVTEDTLKQLGSIRTLTKIHANRCPGNCLFSRSGRLTYCESRSWGSLKQ